MPLIVFLAAYYNEMKARKNGICYQKAIQFLKTDKVFLELTKGKKFYYVGHGSKNSLYIEATQADYTILCVAEINSKKQGFILKLNLKRTLLTHGK